MRTPSESVDKHRPVPAGAVIRRSLRLLADRVRQLHGKDERLVRARHGERVLVRDRVQGILASTDELDRERSNWASLETSTAGLGPLS
jgi:hypothetical protein